MGSSAIATTRQILANLTRLPPANRRVAALKIAIEFCRIRRVRSHPVRWEGPIPSGDVPARMRQCSVFVLPSVSPEPYPMSVLEAMSVGLPVVVTEDCGLASIVRKYNCGAVIKPGAHNVARAVDSMLAAPERARDMGQRGRTAVRHDLGMSYVGQRLAAGYAAAVSAARRS